MNQLTFWCVKKQTQASRRHNFCANLLDKKNAVDVATALNLHTRYNLITNEWEGCCLYHHNLD